MTINSTSRTAGPFTGNGLTRVFPFIFKVFTRDDVLVATTNTATNVETILTLDSDYTVGLNADQNASPGGTITMSVAPPFGTTLAATSNIPYLQKTDLTNQGGFYPRVISDALDKATIQIQQLASKVGVGLNVGAQAAVAKVLAFIDVLATAPGSSLVGFIQAGIGAVLRTMQDKGRETVSVMDFGAKGIGGDDTAAILAAYAHLVTKGGGTLVFPNPANNVYGMSGDNTLRIRDSNIHIQGNGAALKLLGPFSGSYLYFPTCYAQNGLIKIYAKTDSSNDYVENISIDGLRLLDTPTTDGSHCYNLTIQQARNVRISNCDFARANIGGVHVTGSQYSGATDAGVGNAYDRKLLYQTNNVTIESCFFDGEGVQAPHLENNARVGVQVEGRAFKVAINNCRFKDCIKAYVRDIGGIGTVINNPQVWTTASIVNGNNIASGAWPWPGGQIGTSGRPDGSVMATAIGTKVCNASIQVHNLIGYDVQRSLETSIIGGQIYNRNSDTSFTAVNGQNTVKVDSAIGRVKSQRHKYLGVFTNGAFSFSKPAGEDATYQDVKDIAIIGCSGYQQDTSGVVSGLNFVGNTFQVLNSQTDLAPRLFLGPSADPTQLPDGDYHPGSVIVNSFNGAKGDLAIVKVGGTVFAQFPLGTLGYSTGGYSFTTNVASGFRPGIYVNANGAQAALVANVIANGDGTGTVYTYSAIPAGNGFAVTVAAPVLDMPNAATGTTFQRPVLQPWQAGFAYYDNTISKMVFWTGAGWIDSAGAAI